LSGYFQTFHVFMYLSNTLQSDQCEKHFNLVFGQTPFSNSTAVLNAGNDYRPCLIADL